MICFFWFQASSINKDESYTLVVFNTSVLAEIATYKSSISGAWKVEPSTFDLLTRILDPTNKIMAVQFPGVQHSILTTLYTHSQRCNNFVPGPKSKSSGNCKDSNHLIKVLCSILSEQSSSTSAKYWLLLFCNMLFRVAKLPVFYLYQKALVYICTFFWRQILHKNTINDSFSFYTGIFRALVTKSIFKFNYLLLYWLFEKM